MIKLNHITKRFESGDRTVTAVDDVSLAINAGEVFGIIGFSGAGKSTLVRCINLLERPTSGEVIVDGVDLTQLDEKALRQVRQRIGMIFQHFNLMPSRTVTENIEMPLKLTTLTPAERKAKISSLLELVELSDKADAYPSQLSGVNHGQTVYLLTYTGSSAGKPLMVELYQRFGVEANIIFGNVELLKGTPLGKLAVTLSGTPESVGDALEFIRSQNVVVEAL